MKESVSSFVGYYEEEHEKRLKEYYSRLCLVERHEKYEYSGETADVLCDHRAIAETLLSSLYYNAFYSINDLLLNDNIVSLQAAASFSSLLLMDIYTQPNAKSSSTRKDSIWKCQNPTCNHWNSVFNRYCQFCLQKRYSEGSAVHIVFFLHGYRAGPADMKRMIDMLSLKHTNIKCHNLQSCCNRTNESLLKQASAVVQEITSLLSKEKHSIARISFISHSIGSLVLRLAVNSPLLLSFRERFHFFLSINSPHFGILFANKTTDLGGKLLSKIGSNRVLDELMLLDEKAKRNSLIYKMSQNTGLEQFRFFYLYSSCQDTFIPFHSERAETTPAILASDSENGTIYQEMINAFWRELKSANCTTVVKKFDVYYDTIDFSLDSILGKTTHNNILRDVNAIQMLLYKMEECFQ